MLVHRIGRHGELDPFAAPGNDGQDSGPRIDDPHIVLQLGHMFLGGPLLREGPRQHELGFEDGPAGIDQPVQGRRHPFDDGMLDPPLHVLDGMTGVAFVPTPVEVLGDGSELDDKVVGQVLWFDLATLFAPKATQIAFVASHDYPRVRTPKERKAIPNFQLFQHSRLQRSMLSCLCSLHMLQ